MGGGANMSEEGWDGAKCTRGNKEARSHWPKTLTPPTEAMLWPVDDNGENEDGENDIGVDERLAHRAWQHAPHHCERIRLPWLQRRPEAARVMADVLEAPDESRSNESRRREKKRGAKRKCSGGGGVSVNAGVQAYRASSYAKGRKRQQSAPTFGPSTACVAASNRESPWWRLHSTEMHKHKHAHATRHRPLIFAQTQTCTCNLPPAVDFCPCPPEPAGCFPSIPTCTARLAASWATAACRRTA